MPRVPLTYLFFGKIVTSIGGSGNRVLSLTLLDARQAVRNVKKNKRDFATNIQFRREIAYFQGFVDCFESNNDAKG